MNTRKSMSNGRGPGCKKPELVNYEKLLSEMADLAYICDVKGSIVYVNPIFEKLTGHKPEEFIGKSFKLLFDMKNGKKALAVYAKTLEGNEPRYELCFKNTGIVCEFKNIPRRDEKGNIIGVMGTARDVSEHIRMEKELMVLTKTLEKRVRERTLALEKANKELFRKDELRRLARDEISRLSAVVEKSINVIFITDTNGSIEYINPAFEKITGFSKDEAIGKSPRMLKSEEASAQLYADLWNTILAGRTWRGTLKNKKKDGRYYYCENVISPICDEKGQITHFLCVQEDITEKVELKNRANFAASYESFDGLTGLYNRARFTELVNEWIDYAREKGYRGVLLLMDIDRFRLINDTYGTKIADALLPRMAGFIMQAVTDIDLKYYEKAMGEKEIMESILCRMSGDEFAIFLPSRSEQEGLETAEEIRRQIESLPFEDAGGHVTVSLGIVLYPDYGDTVNDLFQKADAAVYHAKHLGRNRSHIYQSQDLVLEKMHKGVEWKGRIQKALKENRFEPWFQPILDLKTDKVSHYESLARMLDEEGKVIMPGLFVDMAETFGLIGDIDRMIIEKTLKYKTKVKERGLCFSVNLSGKDLWDKALLGFLKDKIKEAGIDAQRLIFEITETAAIHELKVAVEFINTLKEMGCNFSLDDFGVGFTSFRYLQEMRIDYIKIDGTFVTKLVESRHDRLFVKSMVDVAKGMGIKTVAEFVENKETIAVLREYGVDYAQGYFVGKPAPGVV